jgi:F420-0:gamma-glutamyl ligase-like protein
LVVSLPNREIALKDVDHQKRRIARQREFIDRLAASGQSTEAAQEMLRTMEHTPSIMELELLRFPAVR